MEGEIRLDETADAEDLFDVSRRLFGGFKGQALFSLLCLVNHSCEPSTVARFSSWKGRAMVRLEALRDIEAGEELTMSYIDEGESLEERKVALASYGFVFGEGARGGSSDPGGNSDVD
jgi:SET domain-containing protein